MSFLPGAKMFDGRKYVYPLWFIRPVSKASPWAATSWAAWPRPWCTMWCMVLAFPLARKPWYTYSEEDWGCQSLATALRCFGTMATVASSAQNTAGHHSRGERWQKISQWFLKQEFALCYLLMFHWPKQVRWPQPVICQVGKYKPPPGKANGYLWTVKPSVMLIKC